MEGARRRKASIASLTAVQEIVGRFVATFRDFPARQKPAKFNLDNITAKLRRTGAN